MRALLLSWSPCKLSTRAKEGSEWGYEGGEVQDELAVVVGEANEAAHVRALC